MHEFTNKFKFALVVDIVGLFKTEKGKGKYNGDKQTLASSTVQ